MSNKSFKNILEESEDPETVEAAEKLVPEESLKLLATAEEIAGIESCANSSMKVLKVIECINKRGRMKTAQANYVIATTMGKWQEDNKVSKWDFRAFEPQDEEVFRSGEFKIWIRDLKDYCQSNNFSDEHKLKGLLHKSGRVLQDLISLIKTTKPDVFDNFENSVSAITDELTPPGGKGLIDFTFRSCEQKPGETRNSYLTRLVKWSTYVGFPTENDRATAILNTAMQKIACEKLKSDIYKYGFIELKPDMMNVVKQIINLAKVYDSQTPSIVKKVEKRQAHNSDDSSEENESKVMNVQKKKSRRTSRDRDHHSDSRIDMLEKSIKQLIEQQAARRPGPSRTLVRPQCSTCNRSHFGQCWNTMKCSKCHKTGHSSQNCFGRYRERSRSPPRRNDKKYDRSKDNSKFDRSRKRVMKTEKIRDEKKDDDKVKQESSDSDSD